ncbi:hypothetical protein KFE25_002013 [Diacronema lutheri]|uniref:Uncharacterized protein n=1 Tax=Diacronema lutheri TaxID=2081491 RepID=A0A8J5XKX2_DIALT|nr:hypothetical protein KFE25_002013 [Diacronema lutheri]
MAERGRVEDARVHVQLAEGEGPGVSLLRACRSEAPLVWQLNEGGFSHALVLSGGASREAMMTARVSRVRAADEQRSSAEALVELEVPWGVDDANLDLLFASMRAHLAQPLPAERCPLPWHDDALADAGGSARLSLLAPPVHLGALRIVQPRVPQQWHPNLCGAHALFDVRLMLELADREASRHGGTPASAALGPLADARADACACRYVVACLHQISAHQRESGAWATLRPAAGVLDAAQLRWLAAQDPQLRDRVLVFDELPADLDHELRELRCAREQRRGALAHPPAATPFVSFVSQLVALVARAHGQRVGAAGDGGCENGRAIGVIFGAVHHWLALVLLPAHAAPADENAPADYFMARPTGDGNIASACMALLILDSDNKPLLSHGGLGGVLSCAPCARADAGIGAPAAAPTEEVAHATSGIYPRRPAAHAALEARARSLATEQLRTWAASERKRRRLASGGALDSTPDSVLDALFEAGTPRYFAGVALPAEYWPNKPARLLAQLVLAELAEVRAAVVLVCAAVRAPGGCARGADAAAGAADTSAGVDAGAADGAHDEDAHDEDAVWFGSRPCCLLPTDGEVVAFSRLDDDLSDAALRITLSRAELVAGADGIADISLPATPARELREAGSTLSPACAAMPELLARHPLLKVPPDLAGNPPACALARAVASGVRSAIVRVPAVGGRAAWYRLKGCGNGEDGFVVRTLRAGAGAPRRRELRGCAFAHTAKRECAMSARLAQIAPGMLGNEPLGWALYGGARLGQLPLGDAPELRPVCAILRTVGDRRLGTHVLTGLAILLPSLVAPTVLDAARGAAPLRERVRALFPPERPDGLTVETAQLVTDAMIAIELRLAEQRPERTASADGGGGGGGAAAVEPALEGSAPSMGARALNCGLSWPKLSRDERCFAFVGACVRADTGAAAIVDAAPDPAAPAEQWTEAGAVPMHARWQPRWRAACARLAARLADLPEPRARASILGYAYSRLGYECGRWLRAMHLARCSWGTFQDRACFDAQWHCNAHANNAVMRPPSRAAESGADNADETGATDGADGSRNFLAFLDLDLAFDEQSYVDLTRLGPPQPPAASAPSEHERAAVAPAAAAFTQLLVREHVSFLETLVGADASSGVPQVALSALRERAAATERGEALHGVQSALHDTLALGYLRGYSADARFMVAPYDARLHAAAYDVIELAVIATAELSA